jgi:putative hydrolase of the HAD superfamily
LIRKDNIQQIFFDLDHTIWDFETNSLQAITELYAEFNLDELGVGVEDYFPVYLRCNEHCWDMYRKNQMNKDLLRHQRFYLSFKEFGKLDRPLAKKVSKRYIEMSPLKTCLMPGSLEILDYLQPKYPLHIITNGFEEVQFLKMKNSGIEKYFTHVITSEKVGRRKPEPRIFEYALKKINCLPQHALMIGDDLNTDVKGAINSGIPAIWYNHHQKEAETQHFAMIHHLEELKNYL